MTHPNAPRDDKYSGLFSQKGSSTWLLFRAEPDECFPNWAHPSIADDILRARIRLLEDYVPGGEILEAMKHNDPDDDSLVYWGALASEAIEKTIEYLNWLHKECEKDGEKIKPLNLSARRVPQRGRPKGAVTYPQDQEALETMKRLVTETGLTKTEAARKVIQDGHPGQSDDATESRLVRKYTEQY